MVNFEIKRKANAPGRYRALNASLSLAIGFLTETYTREVNDEHD